MQRNNKREKEGERREKERRKKEEERRKKEEERRRKKKERRRKKKEKVIKNNICYIFLKKLSYSFSIENCFPLFFITDAYVALKKQSDDIFFRLCWIEFKKLLKKCFYCLF